MKELWKEIERYEGLYSVSNLGRVLSHRKNKILRPKTGKKLIYQRVALWKGSSKDFYIHRLVAKAFCPNTNNLPQVNHKDEDKCNNQATNLEWTTNQLNSEYSTAKAYIFINPDNEVVEVFNMRRYCRDNNIDRNYLRLAASGTSTKGWSLLSRGIKKKLQLF